MTKRKKPGPKKCCLNTTFERRFSITAKTVQADLPTRLAADVIHNIVHDAIVAEKPLGTPIIHTRL